MLGIAFRHFLSSFYRSNPVDFHAIYVALVDLFFDIKTKRLVRSLIDEGPFTLPSPNQEDTLEINLWVYKRDYTRGFGNLFTVEDISALDLFVSVGSYGNALASQATFSKINNNQTFSGKLALNTAGLIAVLTDAGYATTFEIRLFKNPDIYYRGAFPITIYKSVALAAAVTTPATSAALSQNEAAATYVPYELGNGRGLIFNSEDGTQRQMFYLHNDGSPRWVNLI